MKEAERWNEMGMEYEILKMAQNSSIYIYMYICKYVTKLMALIYNVHFNIHIDIHIITDFYVIIIYTRFGWKYYGFYDFVATFFDFKIFPLNF